MSSTTTAHKGGRWIERWEPEDEEFWEATGKRTAMRNLIFSVLSEHIGFSVWTLWSVMVLFMGPEYGIDPAGKFFLVAMPTLVGAVIRVPYTFAVARFGGRNWTIFAALLLLLPTVVAYAVMKPGTSYTTFMVVAALTGVGGGNFASSMTNINSFYPLRHKGWALGLNAGGGNIGVPVVQLVGLAVIGAAGGPRVVLAVYIPLVIVSALCAALFMNNLAPVRNDVGAAREAVRDAQTWIMSLLYIGTFGSFIGFSFAFGLVLQNQFGRTPLQSAAVTFIGPLLGSIIRPLGGWLSDKMGGAKITFWNFVAMAAAASVVLYASIEKSLPIFLVGFIALFVFAGVGNGSTYKMIPAIFQAKAKTKPELASAEQAEAWARRLSGASMGIIGAVGALGGLFINLAFRQSFLTVKSGTPAFVSFLGAYAVCFILTWAVYLRRKPSPVEQVETPAEQQPQLSYAEV